MRPAPITPMRMWGPTEDRSGLFRPEGRPADLQTRGTHERAQAVHLDVAQQRLTDPLAEVVVPIGAGPRPDPQPSPQGMRGELEGGLVARRADRPVRRRDHLPTAVRTAGHE